MTYYVNISTEEMMDIILSYAAQCTLHVFQNVDIDVMHNHEDKHPAWSESEISISVLSRGEMVFKGRCKWIIIDVVSCLHLD